ncbi:RHS repeat domain-containing protein, partial [Acinetobacter baumannii]
AYDINGNLTSVTYPDNKTRRYIYDNPNFPYALTGLTDENGARFTTWTYDAQGRAISSEHASGIENYTLGGYGYGESPA